MSSTECHYLDALFSEDKPGLVAARKEKILRRRPFGIYEMELSLALRARPASEPLRGCLAEKVAGLLDVPAGVACGILFEYQGKARCEPELALAHFVESKVNAWKRGPGKRTAHLDVVRTWGPLFADALELRLRGLKRTLDCAAPALGCCHVPTLEDAKVFSHGTGSMKRSRFKEPQVS